MTPGHEALATRLRDTSRLTGRFVLRSGSVADVYFDKYLFEADPELLHAVADLAAPLVPEGTELLAGLELGGVPVATALSLRTGLPQVLVREDAVYLPSHDPSFDVLYRLHPVRARMWELADFDASQQRRHA